MSPSSPTESGTVQSILITKPRIKLAFCSKKCSILIAFHVALLPYEPPTKKMVVSENFLSESRKSEKMGIGEKVNGPKAVVDPDFIPVFTSWPQKIDIHNSFWFTLESLLACTSTGITLQRSHLEDNDLDEIFRKWKTRVFPNLKYLKICAQSFESIATTVLGMNWRELAGTVIQTDDGSKKATIDTSVGSIEMDVTPFN